MTVDEAVLLFIFRLGAAALILAFLGTVLLMLWVDFRAMTREIENRRVPKGTLVVLACDEGTMELDAKFSLLPLTSLGRALTNSITIPDTFASNEHALIAYRGGQWWLEDRGSSNGTTLNGSLINEPVILSSGDLIGVGHATLRAEFER